MLGPFLSNHLMKRRFQFLLMRQKGLSCIRCALVITNISDVTSTLYTTDTYDGQSEIPTMFSLVRVDCTTQCIVQIQK